MSRLEQLAATELRKASAQVSKLWGKVVNNGLLGTSFQGHLLDADELAKSDALMERYKRAKACYDEGKYLACLEIAVDEQ